MKFVLEIGLDAGTVPTETTAEIGRVLRYWAGNLKHYDLAEGVSETVSDSSHAPVGAWRSEA